MRVLTVVDNQLTKKDHSRLMYGEVNRLFVGHRENPVISSAKSRSMIVTAAAGVFLMVASLLASPARADSVDDRGVAVAESMTTSADIATKASTLGSPRVNSVVPFISYCATGRVQVAATSVNIRAAARTDAPILTVGNNGSQYNCIGYVLGDRYSACGVSNGNGWLMIPFGSPVQYYGFAVQACFKDV